MGKYVKQWELVKKQSEAKGLARPKETTKKLFLGTVQKSTGITPALEAIDKAIEKKERLPLEKALNNYHSVQETYIAFLQKERKPFMDAGDTDALDAFSILIQGMGKIESDAAEDLRDLQVQKLGARPEEKDQKSIKFFFLEADVKGTIDHGKKEFTLHPEFAKSSELAKVMKACDAATTTAQAYTKAAARTDYAGAAAALTDFQEKAKAVAKACDPAIAEGQKKKAAIPKTLPKAVGDTMQKYIDALQSFKTAWTGLGANARISKQLQDLKGKAAAG